MFLVFITNVQRAMYVTFSSLEMNSNARFDKIIEDEVLNYNFSQVIMFFIKEKKIGI